MVQKCSVAIPEQTAILKEKKHLDLKGKKLIILGERDGVPAHTIEQAIDGLGAKTIYANTQCFV